MVGDFNFPFIQWPSRRIYSREDDPGAMSSEKEQGKMLLEWSDMNFMEQRINTATRKENILDLVFTNTEQLVERYETIVNSILSDHNTILIHLNIEEESNETKEDTNPYPNKIFEYNLMKGSNEDWVRYEKMIEVMSKDFEVESKDENTTEKYNRLIKIIEEVVAMIFEKKESFKKPEERTKKGNKIPKKVRLMLRKKRSISDKIMNSNSATKTGKLMLRLQKIEKELEENQKRWKMSKEKEALTKIKKNPKYFYNYANKHAKLKNKVGPLINEKQETVKEPFEMAELLRKQYESTFSQP